MKCSPLLVYFLLSNLIILIYLPVIYVINSREPISKTAEETEALRKVTPHISLYPGDRRLAYMEYGQLHARNASLVFLLASPGTRIFRHPDMDQIAAENGLRMVSVDRPGIGLSDPHPADRHQHQRRAARFAQDLHALAQHLGHQSFSIIGFSAGAPYAIVAAQDLGPSIVSRLHLISPLFGDSAGVPVVPDRYLSFLYPLWRWSSTAAMSWSWVPGVPGEGAVFRWLGKAAGVWGTAAAPHGPRSKETMLKMVRESPMDGPVLIDPSWGRIMDRSLGEVCRTGTEGLAAEMGAHTYHTVTLLAHRRPPSPSSRRVGGRLRCRTTLYYGEEDVYTLRTTAQEARDRLLPVRDDGAGEYYSRSGYGHVALFSAELDSVLTHLGDNNDGKDKDGNPDDGRPV
eukprot:gb/GECH01007232.1/.p1 GENE.gb/GECH01007232.1/~~gb/GECH01007232.1/.p1  ORF type:complete len:400 (+),score=77.03 gb/GECH01007232.1/:1-1200(+)